MKDALTPLCQASQRLIRTHGQGRLNVELAERFARDGYCVTTVSADCEESLRTANHAIRVPRRLPTNWASEAVFRRRGTKIVERLLQATPETLLVTNGAAISQGGDVNIANFVHAAWLRSPWHPRQQRTWHGRYLATYNAANVGPERRAFAEARRVVAVSQAVRGELIEHAGVDAGKVDVIPPGIETSEFRPAANDAEASLLRRTCGLGGTRGDLPMLLMFAGEIRSSRKNLDLVLRMLAALPDVHLGVAGDAAGSPYPRLSQSLSVAERVHFLGQRPDLPALLRGADGFVFPSHYEPFGLVVTEAMASELPVAVTRQTGSASFVRDGAGVLLQDGADLDALVETVRRWRDDPDARVTTGRRAREVASEWTWEAMADRYVQLLRTLA